MQRIAIFIIFEIKRLRSFSAKSRSSNISINESQELSRTPSALIDTLTNFTSRYEEDKEWTRGLYLFNFRSLFVLRLLSKPTVSSRIYMALVCLLCKIRSGLKVSPLIKLGDENEGRSA